MSDRPEESKNQQSIETQPAEATTNNWDGPHDQRNPRNWSRLRKWTNMLLLGGLVFLDALGSSITAAAIPALIDEFGVKHANRVVITLVTSVYNLGIAFGPTIMAPLSELLGRWWLYQASNVVFISCNIACARSGTLGMLVPFRLLAGCASAAPVTIGAGTITDLYREKERGVPTAIWAGAAIIGPIIGPVAGALISYGATWRWTFWLLVIIGGFLLILCLFFLDETNPAAILKLGGLRGRLCSGGAGQDEKAIDTLCKSLYRPIRLLFREPLVSVVSIWSALSVAHLFILFTSVEEVLIDKYDFSLPVSSLAFVAMGIGAIAGQILYTALSDRTVRLHDKGGDLRAEHRLPWMMLGSLALPIGLFWFGWSSEAHTHWMSLFSALFVCGLGLAIVLIAPLSYLIDVYEQHAASAITGSLILRALSGAFFPLIGPPLFHDLGYGWGCSVLAFMALVFVPVPVFLYKYGESFRKVSVDRVTQ
ncbi:MFS transporter cpaT [Pseudocercospora fuligena]|uniref:MFS transporter cpaT n=1 Tax=Pseudocercospora fuligena TaxID=685502 RepID=A0A8H6R8U4_9PEZI|nr:MFS transporter cpaT [Pseudocercospora fuligena]